MENDNNFSVKNILSNYEKRNENNSIEGITSDSANKDIVSKNNKIFKPIPYRPSPKSYIDMSIGCSSYFDLQRITTFDTGNARQNLHDFPRAENTFSCEKRKRSWSRAVFSNLQRKGLERQFEVQKYITKPDRKKLAQRLNLSDSQVKVWFQNRRMKERHRRNSSTKNTEKQEANSESDEEIDVLKD